MNPLLSMLISLMGGINPFAVNPNYNPAGSSIIEDDIKHI